MHGPIGLNPPTHISQWEDKPGDLGKKCRWIKKSHLLLSNAVLYFMPGGLGLIWTIFIAHFSFSKKITENFWTKQSCMFNLAGYPVSDFYNNSISCTTFTGSFGSKNDWGLVSNLWYIKSKTESRPPGSASRCQRHWWYLWGGTSSSSLILLNN